MPRKRNPNREKAFTLWRDSAGKKTLKMIAKELAVSESTVSNWKSADQWVWCIPQISTADASEKDLYEEIYWDTLAEDERKMIISMRMDEGEALLKDQIRLLTVRERRLLQWIGDARASGDALTVQSVVDTVEQRSGSDSGDGETLERTTTNRLTGRSLAQRYEVELTRVQAQKTRCIQALSKLRLEREKLAFKMGITAEEEQNKADPFVEALADSAEIWEEQNE